MAALRGPRRWLYRGYQVLPGPARDLGEALQRRRAEAAVRALPPVGQSAHRLLVGPLNTAGQAHRWAGAAATLPGVSAQSLTATRRHAPPALGYAADLTLTLPMQLRGLAVHRARVLGTDGHAGMTHVLSESGRPVLGDFHTGTVLGDLPALGAAGVQVGLVVHGSELRDLHRHAELYPHSPFRNEWDERWTALEKLVQRTRATVEAFDGQVFVSTPDLLDFVPGATLLPVVVDVAALVAAAADVEPALHRDRPVVLHAPSNPRLKGTARIEEVLLRLDEEGLVTYRRLSGVPHAQMPTAIAGADIVVDQVVLGNPGVLLAETMAAGRLAVAHLGVSVRQRMAQADPVGEPAPVVEADPDTLEQMVRDVVGERTAYREIATRGPAWARRNHDGVRAAQVLTPFLRQAPD